jgi:hypothetical protein
MGSMKAKEVDMVAATMNARGLTCAGNMRAGGRL